MRRAVLMLVGFVAGCSDGAPDTVSIGEVVRCRDSQPPASLPTLMADAHASAFFSTHPLPLLQNLGGRVLRNPHIVAVFFGNDPLQKTTETLLQSYGCIAAWRGAVAEYGVGDAVYERTIVLPEFPAVHGQGEFEEWMKQQATTLGLRGDDRTFIFYLPAGVDVPVDPCVDSFGNHTSVALDLERALETSVAYAVINQCPISGWATSLDARAHITTHELMEMAVDPFPSLGPAWTGLDHSHLSLSLEAEENADACSDLQVLSPDYPFPVAAGWSNRRAVAGLDPCTPNNRRLAVAYPQVTTLDLTAGSAELDLDVYSDDPTATYTAVAFTVVNGPCITTEPALTSALIDGSTLHVKLTVQPGSTCTGDAKPDRLVVFLVTPDHVNAPLASEVILTGIPRN